MQEKKPRQKKFERKLPTRKKIKSHRITGTGCMECSARKFGKRTKIKRKKNPKNAEYEASKKQIVRENTGNGTSGNSKKGKLKTEIPRRKILVRREFAKEAKSVGKSIPGKGDSNAKKKRILWRKNTETYSTSVKKKIRLFRGKKPWEKSKFRGWKEKVKKPDL